MSEYVIYAHSITTGEPHEWTVIHYEEVWRPIAEMVADFALGFAELGLMFSATFRTEEGESDAFVIARDQSVWCPVLDQALAQM